VNFTIVLLPAARRQFLNLPPSLRERLKPRIDALADNPRPHGVKKLTGQADYYRIRVGDWRIVYTIQDRQLIVLVLRIAHRSDVYR
jgi:mRNA interferase RelE/StbE